MGLCVFGCLRSCLCVSVSVCVSIYFRIVVCLCGVVCECVFENVNVTFVCVLMCLF